LRNEVQCKGHQRVDRLASGRRPSAAVPLSDSGILRL
jgi:hypothetical protein